MRGVLRAGKYVLISFAILLVVIITLLPFVVRWQTVAWLEKQGLEASIGYVSIRPILGSVQINDVQVHAANGEQFALGKLHINIAWRPLVQGWLQVQDLSLEGVTLDLAMGPDILRVGGIAIAPGEEGEDSGGDSDDSASAINRVTIAQFALNDLNLCYTRVDADNLPQLKQCAHLGVLAQLGEMQLGLGDHGAYMLPGIHLEDLQWDDRLRPLSLARIEAVDVANVASPDLSRWYLESLRVGGLSLLPGASPALALDMADLRELAAAKNVVVDSLSLGHLMANLPLDSAGKLAFAPALIARLEELAPVDTSASSPQPAADEAPKLQLQQFALEQLDVNSDRRLLQLSGLGLQKLGLQGSEVSLQGLQLSSLAVLPEAEAPALSFQQLSLNGLTVKEQVDLQSLSLGDTRVQLHTGEQGQLAFAPQLFAQLGSSEGLQAPEKRTEAQPPAMAIFLGELHTAKVLVRADRELLSLDALQLQRLLLEGEAIGLDSLRLDKLAALAPASAIEGVEHYLRIPELTLQGLSKQQTSLGLEQMHISDPELFVHRGSDGQLLMLQELERFAGTVASQGSATAAPEEPQLEVEHAPLQFKIGEVVIGASGQIRVLDESVSPPLSQEFSKLDFAIRHLDASRPEEGAAIHFNLGVNRFGYLKLAGDLAPFGETLNTTIDGELNGLDVRDLSGYAGKYIGYHLDQGTMDADIDVKVRRDDINAAITTRFNKLEVSAIPEADLPEGAEQLGVPLEFALSLLRDNDGMIELKLPIGGNIHSPEFSLSHIINKVLFKVIGETVINYYLPFGLLAKSLVQDGLANLSFQSVVFAPGQALLDSAARENLDRLSEMLQSRQQLHLVFCAPSTRQDWAVKYVPDTAGQDEASRQQPETGTGDADGKAETLPEPEITPEQVTAMTDLAEQRAETVKAYLVDAGVKPGQVILCTGSFEQGRDKVPEMSISIGK
ncbi:MAG: DUF748 domain-containing protein [Gammaproteobacteria bacterium]|nr:MAG: DUF748 domain-containing protein [Gammaproteobacteria bacterium]